MAGDILLGVVTGAQGLNGEVRLKVFAEPPECIAAYGPLHTAEGRTLEIASVRALRGGAVVARFRGVDGRAAAESLASMRLFVARSALPGTARDEFYHADLVGLEAQDGEGRVIGKILAIHNFGAGDVIELDRVEGGTLLLPFTRDFVPVIDLENKRVIVAEPKDNEAEEHRGVE